MSRTVITDANAPNPMGSYNQAVVSNGFIFTAGQVGLDPDTGKFIEESFQQSTDVAYMTKTGSDEFLPIGDSDYADPVNVSRTRGGLVSQMAKGRPEFVNASHIVLCAKIGNRARFWYRNNLAKKILRNNNLQLF